MRFIEKKERIKEHFTTRYSSIVVNYGSDDTFFYKIEDKGDYVVEISPSNDFRVFDFKCNWATWEEFIERQVLEEEECNYTIIEEFFDGDEFEIDIERVV